MSSRPRPPLSCLAASSAASDREAHNGRRLKEPHNTAREAAMPGANTNSNNIHMEITRYMNEIEIMRVQ
jgi:hypothetical protein